MIRWDSQAVFSDFSDQPGRSTVEAKSILLGEIRSLDSLPWRVKHPAAHRMNVYGRPSAKQHLSTLGSTNRYCVIEDEERSNRPSDSDNELQRQKSRNELVNRKLAIAKAVQDRYTFKRNLYEQCGWPDNFQGDEFERRCGIVEKEFFEMAKLLGPAGMQIQNIEEGRQLREWYRQKAEAILM
ncbi:hypothetical protein BDV97DRAFT_140675 [Delphinella strobiligena]|nr:hypothetical protein BDV97DRAFT_140675 [Delphinella strobiligena]